MNQELLQQMMQGMDEDSARRLIGSIDDEELQAAVEKLIDDMVVPHLDDIKAATRNRDDPADIREYYESMHPDQRENEFYETLDELIAVLVECRTRPREGFRELKTMLRDPYTTEALLLIFENEEHIDEEYTEQLKDFASVHLRWAGAMVIPEMYDDHEVDEVLDTFDIDRNPGEADVGR